MNLFRYALSLSILVTISCGKSGNNKPTVWSPELNSSQAKWSILVFDENFPSKITMKFNDYTILDECSDDYGPFEIIRGSITSIMSQGYNNISGSAVLKMEILDRGYDCNKSETYHYDENQEYLTETENDQRYVDIEIY